MPGENYSLRIYMYEQLVKQESPLMHPFAFDFTFDSIGKIGIGGKILVVIMATDADEALVMALEHTRQMRTWPQHLVETLTVQSWAGPVIGDRALTGHDAFRADLALVH